MKLLLSLLLVLTLISSSSAIYCLCKDGVGETDLQTTIDYACGAGADCNPIHETGTCYQPNTVKNHCDWAANSYFQKMAQIPGSCNFSGTAATTPTPPSSVANGCVYPSSPGNSSAGGTTPPSTTPPTGTTPTNGSTGTPPGTPPFSVTPTFGPTGGFNPGNGASSLFRPCFLTLCFSSLMFLWGSDLRLGFCHV